MAEQWFCKRLAISLFCLWPFLVPAAVFGQQCEFGPSKIVLAPQGPIATQGLAPVNQAATAARLVHAYECSGDPFLCVGPEDWLSLGASQWNFGTGSAQGRLLKGVPASVVMNAMPKYGATLLHLLDPTTPRAEIQETLLNWRDGSKIRGDVAAELKTLLSTSELQDRQLQLVKGDADQAYRLAAAWAFERRQGLPTFRELTFFMDAKIFSGGYRGVWVPALEAFEQRLAATGYSDRKSILGLIAKWYRECPSRMYGQADAAANADYLEAVDPNTFTQPSFDLLLLGFLRANVSTGCNGHNDAAGNCLAEWQGVFRIHVLNRATSFAIGRAKHNGQIYRPYLALDPEQLVLPSN